MSAPTYFDWTRYVSLFNERGRRWVAFYRQPCFQKLTVRSDRALDHLRKGRTDEGEAELAALLDGLGSLEADGHDPVAIEAVGWVLRRWYNSAEAYARYLRGDYDGAETALRDARSAVEQAISLLPELLPIADHCADFRVQSFRIARSRGLWDELPGRVPQLRGLADGSRPLCEVEGRGIYLADLRRYYAEIEDLPEDERVWLDGLLEERFRLDFVDTFLRNAYSSSGFVIPYA